ncbi:unnamed protein product [Amaranthus hypochondriacus]
MNIQFFFFTFFLLSTSSSSSLNYLHRGSSISVEDASSNLLTSPDKTFTCGFYTFNVSTNAYFFSIWFTNSKEKTIVWTANREKPVNGRGSKITLRGDDGALVLTDLDGSIVWETNTSSTDVYKSQLLDSGNLVLVDQKGKVFWQSFDFPTNTLLPNQTFTTNKKLVSWLSSLNIASGYYSFFFDNDNALKLTYDGPEISGIYWPNPDNSLYDNGRINYNISRVASFDELGSFVSSDLLVFRGSDSALRTKRRLTMDYDGNLRLYSLDSTSGLWTITWQAIAKLCNVHGLCGRNGICIYTPKPRCSCPPYFEPSDSSDWSKGCKPKFNRSSSKSRFIEVPHVDYYGFDLNYTQNISFRDCKNLCLGDFRCQAFKRIMKGSMPCYTKGALFNGYPAKTSMYMRIPVMRAQNSEPEPAIFNVSSLDCPRKSPKHVVDLSKHRFKWVYVYSFVGVIGVIEVLVFCASWCFLIRKKSISASIEEGYRKNSSQYKSFSYSELKNATEKFKQVLGKGGYGTVYKGLLADTREIAVKRLENIVQGEEEFWAEVSTFSRINHMNLARMWGFCSEKKHKLLVYEYVKNGSLDKHLFSDSINSVLNWENRFNIALGTAKGLAYLHHECLEWVIHCDVKPENILLDEDFEPKISDFGLAKLCQRGCNGLSEMSKIRGTKGYMAPEWTTNLPLTAKIDVYSFGVVVLELVRGKRLSSCLVDDDNPEDILELKKLARFVKGKMQDGDESWIEGFVDSRLEGMFSKNQAAKMVEIGLSCVEEDRNKRPTMEHVAQLLTECKDETNAVHIL